MTAVLLFSLLMLAGRHGELRLGDPDPPRLQRVFWSIMTGVVVGSLSLGGGLVTLQTAAIPAGLPFTVVLLLLCVGGWRAVLLEESSGRQMGTADG